jgi:hypothetical protein
VVAWRHSKLRTVGREDHTAVLRLLAKRHHDLVAHRTRAVCLHTVLCLLIAGGLPRRLSAARAAAELRWIRPTDQVGSERRRLALELLTEVRAADRDLVALKARITSAVDASSTTVTDVAGVGPIMAAYLIGYRGDVRRFPTAGHYARYHGTAPIEASSGPRVRHRLNPRGNRQLNHALHIAAVTQAAHDTPGRAYYLRKQAEGKTKKEALAAGAAAADHYDAYEHAWLLCSLAGIRSMVGEVDAAADDAERGLLIARSMANPILAMYALGQSAFTLASRDPERARARLVVCASLQRALGDRYVDDVNFVVTAVVGAFVEEAEITCRAAAVVLDRGVTTNPLVLAPMLEAVGSCLADRAPEDAAVIQGAVDALAPGMRDWGMYGEIREQATARVATLVTPEMIDRLHARGAAMTLDDARSFVAELIERVIAGDFAPATTQ